MRARTRNARAWRTDTVPRPELPETWAPVLPGSLAGLYRATRGAPSGAPTRAFQGFDAMWDSLSRGELALDETVRLNARDDTVGRHLVAACLPSRLRTSRVWDAGVAARALADVHRRHGAEVTARCADALERLGAWVFARHGASLCADALAPPSGHRAIVDEALAGIAAVQHDYDEGLITDGERYNKVVDLASFAHERSRDLCRVESPGDGALATLTQRGPALATLRASGGLFAKRSGEIVERPVLRTLVEGREPHEAAIAWTSARIAAVRDSLPPRETQAVLHDVHAALGPLRVSVLDCGTSNGVIVTARRIESNEVVASAGRVAEGRALAEDLLDREGHVVARAGALVTVALGERIDAARVASLRVRDPLTCARDDGPCVRCLGLDPLDGTWSQPGDALAPRVAFAVTRAMLRVRPWTFHIC
ncbi:MAG: hypothetical protein R3A48_24945 [Polyangiales bacterium]